MSRILLDDPAHVGGSDQLLIGTTLGDGTGDLARVGGTKLKQWAADVNAMTLDLFSGRSKYIAGSSTPVKFYGNAATAFTAATFAIPAGSLMADSLLELTAMFDFIGANASRSITISLGGVLLGNVFPTITQFGLQIKFPIYVNPDLSGVVVFSQHPNDVTAPGTGIGSPFSAHITNKQPITIDLTSAQTFLIQMAPATGDYAELSAWSLINVGNSIAPSQSYGPTNAVAAWGDSLTAGSGSVSPVGGWPVQLAIARGGQAISSLGIAGQTSAQILARILADKVRGKYWNCIFEMGRNDVGSGTLTATVTANVAAAVANLATGVKYLVCTVIPAANESTVSTNWTNIVALNNALKAAYTTKVADVFAALTANGTTQIAIANRLVTAQTTSTYSSGVTTLTVASATGIVNGMYVAGTGIPDQTTITISGTTVTLSTATTASGSAATLSFVSASEIHMNDAGYAIWETTINTAMVANSF